MKEWERKRQPASTKEWTVVKWVVVGVIVTDWRKEQAIASGKVKPAVEEAAVQNPLCCKAAD